MSSFAIVGLLLIYALLGLAGILALIKLGRWLISVCQMDMPQEKEPVARSEKKYHGEVIIKKSTISGSKKNPSGFKRI